MWPRFVSFLLCSSSPDLCSIFFAIYIARRWIWHEWKASTDAKRDFRATECETFLCCRFVLFQFACSMFVYASTRIKYDNSGKYVHMRARPVERTSPLKTATRIEWNACVFCCVYRIHIRGGNSGCSERSQLRHTSTFHEQFTWIQNCNPFTPFQRDFLLYLLLSVPLVPLARPDPLQVISHAMHRMR